MPLPQISISTSSLRESITYLRHIPILLRLHGVTGGYASRPQWFSNNRRRDKLAICISCCKEQTYRTYFVRREMAENAEALISIWGLGSLRVLKWFCLVLRTLPDPFSGWWWIFHRLQLLAFLKGCIIKSTRSSWSSVPKPSKIPGASSIRPPTATTDCWIKPSDTNYSNVVYISAPIS